MPIIGRACYALLLMALALLGVGGGVVEALLNPLVEELHRDDAGRYLNLLNAFWSVGVLLPVLVTGGLLTREVSWRIIIGGLAALGVVPGLPFSGSGRRRRCAGCRWATFGGKSRRCCVRAASGCSPR